MPVTAIRCFESMSRGVCKASGISRSSAVSMLPTPRKRFLDRFGGGGGPLVGHTFASRFRFFVRAMLIVFPRVFTTRLAQPITSVAPSPSLRGRDGPRRHYGGGQNAYNPEGMPPAAVPQVTERWGEEPQRQVRWSSIRGGSSSQCLDSTDKRGRDRVRANVRAVGDEGPPEAREDRR